MDIAGMSGLTNYLVDSNKNSTQALEKKLDGAAAADVADAELLDACKQFEAYLWEQVYKEMQKAVDLFGDDEDGYASNMVDYFKDDVIQKLSEQTATQGSNSLAQMLYEQAKINYGI